MWVVPPHGLRPGTKEKGESELCSSTPLSASCRMQTYVTSGLKLLLLCLCNPSNWVKINPYVALVCYSVTTVRKVMEMSKTGPQASPSPLQGPQKPTGKWGSAGRRKERENYSCRTGGTLCNEGLPQSGEAF